MNGAKITKERIQNHFAYSWWKYVLLAAAAVFGWNMLYTVTKYQPPPDKQLGVYFVTHSIDSEALDLIRDQILLEMPELEDASCVSVVFSEDDDYYGSIQLSTYVGAAEGDIYIINRKQFNQYASSGPFLVLDDYVASGEIDAQGVSLESGYAVNEDTGARELCGIPATELYGLMEYGIDNRELLICVMGYSKNFDAAIHCADWLIETMKAPKPDWLIQAETEQNIEETTEEYPSY